MPTLPNVTQLERRTPEPQRGVVPLRPAQIPLGPLANTVDYTANAGLVEQGKARMGQAIANLGVTLAEVDAKFTTARRAVQVGELETKATSALGELELSFERDPDFRTAPQRFAEKAEALRSQMELGLGEDDVVKAEFNQRFRKIVTVKHLNVLKSSVKQLGDASVAQLDSDLNTYAHAAANSRSVAERAVVVDQALVRIAETRRAGFITDVDAGNRERGFQGKLDAAAVTRDMAVDAGGTATRLATDPTYAPSIDIAARERLIDTGWRKAETDRNRFEREIEAHRKRIGDAAMVEVEDLLAAGKLTKEKLGELGRMAGQGFVTPAEYGRVRKAFEKQGESAEDNRAAYAKLQGLLYPGSGGPPDIAEVSKAAYAEHAAGRIKDATLSATLAKARELTRTDGPKSPYERGRSFITSMFEPSPMTQDPAPRARQALAIREFDDWFLELAEAKKPPTDAEIHAKGEEVVKKHSMINMQELAKSTIGSQSDDPTTVLKEVETKFRQLQEDLKLKKITEEEFNKKAEDLNKLRKAAEGANRGKR